jgi:ribosomal protein S19
LGGKNRKNIGATSAKRGAINQNFLKKNKKNNEVRNSSRWTTIIPDKIVYFCAILRRVHFSSQYYQLIIPVPIKKEDHISN